MEYRQSFDILHVVIIKKLEGDGVVNLFAMALCSILFARLVWTRAGVQGARRAPAGESANLVQPIRQV